MSTSNSQPQTEGYETLTCPKCRGRVPVSGRQLLSIIECPKCSTKMPVPARFSHFNLLKKISDSDLCTAYEAYDRQLKRHVTLQIFNLDTKEYKDILRKFLTDIRRLSDITHNNIQHILSLGEAKNQLYLVLEVMQGDKVKTLIEFGAAVDEQKALRIGLDIAKGLNAAAKAGVGHGDINPDTILMQKNGQCKVVDFGLSKLAQLAGQNKISSSSTFYVAPEIVAGKKTDHRGDIYSLGTMLWHLMAGRLPFTGSSPEEIIQARLKHAAPDLGKVQSNVSRNTAELLKLMMATRPSERISSYEKIITVMQKITGVEGTQHAAPVAASKGYDTEESVFELEEPAPSRSSSTHSRSVKHESKEYTRKRRKKQTSAGLVVTVSLFGILLLGLIGTLIWMGQTGRIGAHFEKPVDETTTPPPSADQPAPKPTTPESPPKDANKANEMKTTPPPSDDEQMMKKNPPPSNTPPKPDDEPKSLIPLE